MSGFFSMNNPLFQGLSKIAECVLLSLLWLIFCVPLFTIGASTTALYYTVQKCLKNDRGYVVSCFWSSFKQNFKTSVPISLIFLVVYFIAITDITVMNYLNGDEYTMGPGSILFVLIMFVAAIYAVWIFASLARFDNKWKQVMKNALLLATGHWQISLLIAAILLMGIILVYILHVVIFIMPAVCIWLVSAPMEKVFRLYMKNEDKRLDDELNMVYHNDYDDEKRQK